MLLLFPDFSVTNPNNITIGIYFIYKRSRVGLSLNVCFVVSWFNVV